MGGGVRWGGFRGAPYTAKRESGDDHEMRVVAAQHRTRDRISERAFKLIWQPILFRPRRRRITCPARFRDGKICLSMDCGLLERDK